jgi:hypothetical protein
MLKEKTGPPEAPAVPGGVYLCQVGERVSCGACCGLYNCADASRGALEALITSRTEEFRRVPRDPDAITDFQVRMERRDPRKRPYYDFYHCPFLGWVGNGGSRVGCLLHPLSEGNAGIDYRGLSFYGGLACREYFCPSYRKLSAAVKEIVRAAGADWYLYGLVVTEYRLLAGFFDEVERRLERSLAETGAAASPAVRRAVVGFLNLKLAWPFRGPGYVGPGNYIFDDGLHPRPAIDYERLGSAPSRHDGILRELGSGFASVSELRSAEALIERLAARVLEGIRALK